MSLSLLQAACPRCAFPRLLDCRGVYEYQYAGSPVRVTDVEFARCHRCKAETILPEQHRRNGERITQANLEALAAKWACTAAVVLQADALALATSLPAGRGPGSGLMEANDPRYPQARRLGG